MGRRSKSGGVTALGRDRIQFDLRIDGERYRPSIECSPTPSNMKLARARMRQINARIQAGTFCFAKEFPTFRHLLRVSHHSSLGTCREVFDGFLDHCEAQVARNELAATTVMSYRKILDRIWRPHLGDVPFLGVDYVMLNRIANSKRRWSKKTYNNALCALRGAFAFGYRNVADRVNPALGLKSARLRPRERPRPDPFRIYDAELLIAAIHGDWGEAQGNFDEFRFFSGLRPSEQIALTARDYDIATGTLRITKSRVHGIDRNYTKTRQDRVVELNPRAIKILNRQLTLRVRLGVQHEFLFFHPSGAPIRDLDEIERRWRQSLTKLPVRYRRLYCARHTSVSWNLMAGKDPLWVAKQHGHSLITMLRVYAAWTAGAADPDVRAIRRALDGDPQLPTNDYVRGQTRARIAAWLVDVVFRCARLVDVCKDIRVFKGTH